MPTTYAHYRFGKDVLERLPEEIQGTIKNNIDLYNFGVHGPDLLFYYRSIAYNNHVVEAGRRIHHESGHVFFGQASKILKKHKYNEADLAFLYGYICHFTLDIACHGYVNEQVTTRGVPHSTTEAEFDRYLLLKDGVTDDPAGYSPVTHLHPSKENSKVMCPYYRPYTFITRRMLGETQKCSVFMISFITDKSALKRAVRKKTMQLAGPYIGGLIMTTSPDARCICSNKELFRRYELAVDIAVKLICNFVPSAKSGTWDKEYESKFDPLSTDEEISLCL